jgi:integrase
MTFDDLATYFERHYVFPAEYVEGRKVAGVRSVATARSQLKALRGFFGRCRLRSITYEDVRGFRTARLKEPTRSEKQRTIASVNRELSMLRRILRLAETQGWIPKSPFSCGDPLISLADESRRERILTRDEEARLLQACDHPRRAHLLPIVLFALDTGLRQGEILSLRWREVDLENGIITVSAFNTKTMRERQIALTVRLKVVIERLHEASTKEPEDLVFGITDNVKHSFSSARHQAGLDDVRFHDLRHTAATRLVAAQIPLPEVGRVLGHTQANTTYRYVNANLETVRRAAAALDAFHRTAAAENTEEESHAIH